MQIYLFLIISIVIHSLINLDIFRKKATISLPAIREYRVFVISVVLVFIADMIRSIFVDNNIATGITVSTFIYFVFMGFAILCWARYLIKYLNNKGVFEKIVLYTGNLFFLAGVVLLIVNIFIPILFSVDKETGIYTAYKARNIMLYIQILMYGLLMIYSAVKAFLAKGSARRRYMTVTLYSIIMGAAITCQIYNTRIPFYSIGLIVGSCLINAFVINDIKEEYKSKLEESRVQVHQGEIELSETKHIAYTDPLTNVKNKHAYVEEEERIDKLIAKGDMENFAVVVFDLNGLKIVNDTKGHDAGDVYIIDSCRAIEKYFGNENLYRFGGDEFVVILTGDKYKNRSKILNEFEQFIDGCVATDAPIISSGMSKYKKGEDNTYHAVFNRADKIMYTRKEVLKERQSNQ